MVNRMSKYSIRFMPDYYSTSLWPESESSYEEFESPIRYESLNLSSDLIKDLKAFDNSILNILDWNDPAAPSPLGKEEWLNIIAVIPALVFSICHLIYGIVNYIIR